MHAYSKDPARMAAFAAPSTWSAVTAALAAAAAWLGQSRLGTAAAQLWRKRSEQLAIEELRSWDDHMLRDIGLERPQIEPAVRGRFRPLPLDADVPRTPPQFHE
jgi:uncharacterized protein YjiS (DUF1127 family)